MTTTPRRSIIVCVALFLIASWSHIDAQNVRGIADREVARRQNAVAEGQAALSRGDLAMQAKDFAKAHNEYRVAVTFLPDALTTASQNDKAVEGFCDSGARLAE